MANRRRWNRCSRRHNEANTDMSKAQDYLLIASAIISIIGGAFLIWYYFIDGIYVNKVFEYRDGVDPTNYQLEFKEYRVGDTPRYITSFCKRRNAVPTVTWALANDVLTIYPPRTAEKGAPLGCYPEGQGFLYLPIEKIPETAKLGCDHYFLGSVVRDYGGGRTIEQPFKTENFCIIK